MTADKVAEIDAMTDEVFETRLEVVRREAHLLRASFDILFAGVMLIQDPLITEKINFTSLIGEIHSELPLSHHTNVDASVDLSVSESQAHIQAQTISGSWLANNRISGSVANRCLKVLYEREDELEVLEAEDENRGIKREAQRVAAAARMAARRRSQERRRSSSASGRRGSRRNSTSKETKKQTLKGAKGKGAKGKAGGKKGGAKGAKGVKGAPKRKKLGKTKKTS
jgi:hypothetical protein